MTDIKVYHNPSCSTSRKVLDIIREQGIEPTVVEYLKTPLSHGALKDLLSKMGVSVRDILRERGTPYAELDLGNPKWTDDELIAFMAEHPILMNRPIVETSQKAKLCRPIESVFDLLGNPAGQ